MPMKCGTGSIVPLDLLASCYRTQLPMDQEINVLALDLGTTPPTSPIWAASLDQGTHPSDPAYVKTDPSTGYVLITTTDSSTGAVWLWKLNGANGNEAWSPRSMGNTDGDSNVPHVRMPGPIVTNLDSDAALEVVVTIRAGGFQLS